MTGTGTPSHRYPEHQWVTSALGPLRRHLEGDVGGLAEHLSKVARDYDALQERNRALQAENDRLRERTLDELQRRHGAWARATFPHQTPESIVAHMAEEVKELAASHAPSEAADVVSLALGHADLCEYSLLDALLEKMAINQARSWGPPDERGVSHHER